MVETAFLTLLADAAAALPIPPNQLPEQPQVEHPQPGPIHSIQRDRPSASSKSGRKPDIIQTTPDPTQERREKLPKLTRAPGHGRGAAFVPVSTVPKGVSPETPLGGAFGQTLPPSCGPASQGNPFQEPPSKYNADERVSKRQRRSHCDIWGALGGTPPPGISENPAGVRAWRQLEDGSMVHEGEGGVTSEPYHPALGAVTTLEAVVMESVSNARHPKARGVLEEVFAVAKTPEDSIRRSTAAAPPVSPGHRAGQQREDDSEAGHVIAPSALPEQQGLGGNPRRQEVELKERFPVELVDEGNEWVREEHWVLAKDAGELAFSVLLWWLHANRW